MLQICRFASLESARSRISRKRSATVLALVQSIGTIMACHTGHSGGVEAKIAKLRIHHKRLRHTRFAKLCQRVVVATCKTRKLHTVAGTTEKGKQPHTQ